MTHTPRQWRRVEVDPDELSGLGQLSRYEAEAAVDVRIKLAPDWLSRLLAVDYSPQEWKDFLQSPAAAPVLRAAVREIDSVGGAAGEVNRIFYDHPLETIDVDTAFALAVLGYRAGHIILCAKSLDVIIEKCQLGTWDLLGVPVQTWEWMVDLFRLSHPVISPRKGRFLTLLELAVTESIDGIVDDDARGILAFTPFWLLALQIGATQNEERILRMIERGQQPNRRRVR